MKFQSFSLLFQLSLSFEPVSHLNQICHLLFTVMLLATIKSFISSLVFTLLPFFLHPHSLVFLPLMNLWCSFRLSYFLSSLPSTLQIIFSTFPFEISDYFWIRNSQEVILEAYFKNWVVQYRFISFLPDIVLDHSIYLLVQQFLGIVLV